MLAIEKYEKRVKKYYDILVKDERVLALILDIRINADKDIINNKNMVMWIVSDKSKILVVKDGKFDIKLHYIKREQVLNFRQDMLRQIIKNGKIIFDRDGETTKLFKAFTEKETTNTSNSIFVEFVNFIKNYNKSCEILSEGKIYDSFNYIVKAMNNWAKLLIIENKIFLCDDTWETVKTINIGIYKLYEELVGSSESIPDKVKLMQLIFDNAISKQVMKYSNILFEVMKTEESMTLEEIGSRLSINDFEFQDSLEYLLQELTKRKIVKKYHNQITLGELDEDEQFTQVLYGLKKRN